MGNPDISLCKDDLLANMIIYLPCLKRGGTGYLKTYATTLNHQAFNNKAQTESYGWHIKLIWFQRILITTDVPGSDLHHPILHMIVIISSSNTNRPHVDPKWKVPRELEHRDDPIWEWIPSWDYSSNPRLRTCTPWQSNIADWEVLNQND